MHRPKLADIRLHVIACYRAGWITLIVVFFAVPVLGSDEWATHAGRDAGEAVMPLYAAWAIFGLVVLPFTGLHRASGSVAAGIVVCGVLWLLVGIPVLD